MKFPGYKTICKKPLLNSVYSGFDNRRCTVDTAVVVGWMASLPPTRRTSVNCPERLQDTYRVENTVVKL